MGKAIAFGDNDAKSATELWEELHYLYTTSNNELIYIMITLLISLEFDKKKENWVKILSPFMVII